MHLSALLSLLLAARLAAQQKAPAPFQVALDISADGRLVATCGDKVRVFEFASGKPHREFADGPSRCLAFSPAAKDALAVGHEDGIIRLHDATKDGPPREFKGHTGWVMSLAFDKTGKWLAATSQQYGNEAKKLDELGQFKLWDVTGGKAVKTIDVKGGRVNAAAFSDDGKLVAFCRSAPGDDGDATLEVFRPDPWEKVASVKLPAGGLKGTPFGVATQFLPGGKRLMVGGGVCVPLTAAEVFPYKSGCRTTGLLWAVELGDKPAAKLVEEPRRGYFNALAISPDGKRYVTHTESRENSATYVSVRELEGNKTVWEGVDGQAAYGIRFTPDGRHVTCIRFRQIRVYDAADGNALRLIDVAK